jgi:hypothetical protein
MIDFKYDLETNYKELLNNGKINISKLQKIARY